MKEGERRPAGIGELTAKRIKMNFLEGRCLSLLSKYLQDHIDQEVEAG